MKSNLKDNLPSDSWLIYITILFWVIFSISAGFSLYRVVNWPKTTMAWVGLGIFLIAIHVFWALLAHMTACILLNIKKNPQKKPFRGENHINHSVAILLCTRDDWIESVGLSCLHAIRPCDQLLICDDSQSLKFRNQIEDFTKSHPNRCTIIRRSNLKGWKAGNLNNCLKKLPEKFAYFMVVDHDNYIHPEMIAQGLNQLNRHPNLAFVQFPHEEDNNLSNLFINDLQPSIRSIWWILSLRQRYGFRFTVGHSVLFRREMVEKVGGFPENILTEDLAISMRLINEGYIGAYNLSSTAKESIPHTYLRYRARYIRWCVGTLQSWFDCNTRPSILKNSLHIILDALLLSTNLLYGLLFFALTLGLWLASQEVSHSIAYGGGTFKVITILALLSPNIPLFWASRKSGRALQHIAANTAVYFSLIVPMVVAAFSMMLKGHVVFINTGNQFIDVQPLKKPSINKLFEANGLGTLLVEIFVFIWFAIHLKNIGIAGLPVLTGVVCGPLFMIFRWDSLFIKIVKYLPLFSLFLASLWMLSL